MTRTLLFVAGVMARISPAEACQERWRVHHDAYANGGHGFQVLSQEEAYALLDKLGRPRFELDYADIYKFDLSVAVIFFLNGCAVAGVDVVELPTDVDGQ